MNDPISRWLDDDRQPRDYYELLGRRRFDSDTAGLLSALKHAKREVLPYQSHAQVEVARRALALLKLLRRAEEVFSDAAKHASYDQELARAAAPDPEPQRGPAAGSGGGEALATWLLDEESPQSQSAPAAQARMRRGLPEGNAAGPVQAGPQENWNDVRSLGRSHDRGPSTAPGRDSPLRGLEPAERPAASLWDELEPVPRAESASASAPLTRRSWGRGKSRSRAARALGTKEGGGESARSAILILGGGLLFFLAVGLFGYVNDVGSRWSPGRKGIKPEEPGRLSAGRVIVKKASVGDKAGSATVIVDGKPRRVRKNSATSIPASNGLYLNCLDDSAPDPRLVLGIEPQPEPTGPLFLPRLDGAFGPAWAGKCHFLVVATEVELLLRLKARPTDAERSRGGIVLVRLVAGGRPSAPQPIEIPADALAGDEEVTLQVLARWGVAPLALLQGMDLAIDFASPNRGVFSVYGYGYSQLEFRGERASPAGFTRVTRIAPRPGEVIRPQPPLPPGAAPAADPARPDIRADSAPGAGRTMPPGSREAPPRVPAKKGRNRALPPADENAKPAPKAKPNADTLLRLGQALEQQDKYPGAMDYYRKVVDQFPNTPQAKTAEARIKALRERN